VHFPFVGKDNITASVIVYRKNKIVFAGNKAYFQKFFIFSSADFISSPPKIGNLFFFILSPHILILP
jgi:hypothetical protein